MKKLFLALTLAVATICSAFAQTGTIGIGGSIGAVPCLEDGVNITNFQVGARFQYGVSNDIRLEAAFEYGFEDKSISVFDLTLNAHYLIGVTNNFRMYPLAGIGYGNIHSSFAEESLNRFVFNVGVGGEVDIASNLVANLEVKYQYMKDFNRMPITLGIAYKF